MTGETCRWAPVVGWEGFYEVSDDGRVRSLPRTVMTRKGYTSRRPGKVLSAPPNIKSGYPTVYLARDGKQVARTVHSLVMEAFIGPRPAGLEVRHYPDPSPENCRLDNLRYGTRLENAHDKAEHGSHNNTKKTHCKWGHEFTPENTAHPGGNKNHRRCRECYRTREREASARRRRHTP